MLSLETRRLVLFMLVGCTANQFMTPRGLSSAPINCICVSILSTSYWYLVTEIKNINPSCFFQKAHYRQVFQRIDLVKRNLSISGRSHITFPRMQALTWIRKRVDICTYVVHGVIRNKHECSECSEN